MDILKTYEKMVRSLVPETLEKQMANESGTLRDGVIILLLASLIPVVTGLLRESASFAFLNALGSFSPSTPVAASAGSMLMKMGIVVFSPVITIVNSLAATGITCLLARALGGTGTFRNQFFQFAYPTGGALLLMSIFKFVPCLGSVASGLLAVYTIYIAFLIYKKVHNLSRNRALAVVVLPILLGIVLVIILLVLAALWVPSITSILGMELPKV